MNRFFLSFALCLAVACGRLPDCTDIIPQPVKVAMKSGFYKVDSTAFAASPEDYITVIVDSLSEIKEEGYEIRISPSGRVVRASEERGVFYAVQTLSQMVCAQGIPCADIEDSPRFPYRGIHIDVSRHFFPKEEIFRIIHEMARYKFNCLHLHLTDNGGWRLQLDRYPELTSKGAFRTQADWRKWWDNKDRKYLDEGTAGAYGGYYTKDDIREILSCAEKNHIAVIPEIEFPAHSDAVFVSHPELCCAGRPYVDGEFCAGNPAVYEFYFNVLDEVMELFPSEYIHIGADEARKNSWKVCPACNALMEREGIADYEDLQCYMIEKVEAYLASKGRKLAGWDEVTRNNLEKGALVYSYRGQNYTSESANKGQNVVFTPGAALYFDWYQDTPDTQPVAMIGYTPLRKVYEMEPLAVDPLVALRNEEFILGKKLDGGVDFIKPENASNLVGVQGCAWSEFINDSQHLEYMIFPRALAISELGWTRPDLKDWASFRRRVNVHVRNLHRRGINAYPLSDRIDITSVANGDGTSTVTLDHEKENLCIRYTVDGTEPAVCSAVYNGPFRVAGDAEVRAAVFTGDRMTGPLASARVSADSSLCEYYPYVEPEHWKVK